MKSSLKAAGPRRTASRLRSRAGFTLAEVLVVIALIALLVSVLLPVIFAAQRKARGAQIASDLNGISLALEAYRQDFGDYPRINENYQAPAGTYGGDHGTAGQLLAKALLGPGNADDLATNAVYSSSNLYNPGDFVTVKGTPTKYYISLTRNTGKAPDTATDDWAQLPFSYADSADSFGFRVRVTKQGPVRGPYLNPTKFKIGSRMNIVDTFGNPVLYFPARPGPMLDLSVPLNSGTKTFTYAAKGGAAKTYDVHLNYVSRDNNGLYNAQCNMAPFLQDATLFTYYVSQQSATIPATWQYPVRPVTAWDLAPWPAAVPKNMVLTDDVAVRNYIQYKLETSGQYTGPYLLWSPGSDGLYFNDDDVTNFSK